MPSDLYSALIGAPVDSAEKQAALADLLRRKAGFANVAQMTGDPTLAPMGQQQAQQGQQQAQQLQRGAFQQQDVQQTQQQAAFQKQQEARIAGAQQQQLALTQRGQDLDYKAALASTMAHLQAAKEKPAVQPTESERKNATLATRLEGSLKELNDLGSEAETPGLLERGLESVGMETLANTARSSERQRANAAQLDALDAALTLGTGATYTKEQLANFKTQYFPQIGDDKKTVESKQKRFDTIVKAARAASGRASTNIDTSLGGESVAAPAAAPTATKKIGGVAYSKRGGKWYAD